ELNSATRDVIHRADNRDLSLVHELLELRTLGDEIVHRAVDVATGDLIDELSPILALNLESEVVIDRLLDLVDEAVDVFAAELGSDAGRLSEIFDGSRDSATARMAHDHDELRASSGA